MDTVNVTFYVATIRKYSNAVRLAIYGTAVTPKVKFTHEGTEELEV